MAIAADKAAELGFDPETLRSKYREERDRRLRADGNAQYVEISGDYARYLEDPFAPTDFSREPIDERH
ncbi:MAG: hypothetical protein V9G24_12110 [Rhodoblastus sp.]